MNEENRRKLAEYVEDFHLPRYRELPDIGLHLEQVTRYVARYVPTPLTGSMVSNYVKQKLIPGPSKKSYSRDSIAYLIFLSYIKAVMPLENIGLMMEIQKSSYDLQVAYDYFCEEFETLLRFTFELQDTIELSGEDSSDEKRLLYTCIVAAVQKIYLEKCLEAIDRENVEK